MPQVKYNPQKGLYQETKSGLNGFQVENISSGDTSIVHFSQASTAGYGFHRVSCIVEIPDGHGVADNDVVAQVPWYVASNTGTTVTFAAIAAEQLHTTDNGSYALQINTAARAADATANGTEIVGGDTASDKALPDADLNLGSGDTLGQVVSIGTLGIQNTVGATYFQLTMKETATTAGVGKIGVIIEYYGPNPTAL